MFGTIPPGTGIIADIATPAERAGFIGLFGVGPMACAYNAPLTLQLNERVFG